MADDSYEPLGRYRAGTIHLTPYSQPPYASTAGDSQGIRPSWVSPDPRSSSTQSLVPSESGGPDKRTLLLIYIHGFLGNETSFHSFPAHVHNLLKVTLAETHVIHTKVYPRYKSRKAIEFARDDFSAWLSPHESEMTDVILLGHSMGGLLSAEIVLLPHSSMGDQPFRHHILGTINFDTPFLGIHPGVIVSGIGSLFRPSPTPPQPQGYLEETRPSSTSQQPSHYSNTSSPLQDSASHTSPASSLTTFDPTDSHYTTVGNTDSQLSSTPPEDPNYNPRFSNDVRLPDRSGWDGALHFVLKHSGSLPTATKTYVMSHLEFGGCLADYDGLKSRYAKIRKLEDVDDISSVPGPAGSRNGRRVRFVSYYTASTGRPKGSHVLGTRTAQGGTEASEQDMSSLREAEVATTQALSSVHIDDEVRQGPYAVNDTIEVAPGPIQDDILGMNDEDSLLSEDDLKNWNSGLGADSAIPPIRHPPEEPPPFDASLYADKDTRKIAEAEHARTIKAYKQAVKEYSRSIKDRNKLIEKREKIAKQERERGVEIEVKERVKEREEQLRLSCNATDQSTRDSTDFPAPAVTNKKPPRDKKFCMLPPKIAGRLDPTWIRVFMEGVDEVGAHCGLFFIGQAYERLVGDVGTRIEDWVREEETRRVIRQLEETDDY